MLRIEPATTPIVPARHQRREPPLNAAATTREQTTRRLLLALGVGILTLGALRFGMGARWFSFYGVATVVLLVTPPVAAALARRLAVQGFPRWPAWALAVVTCLAAVAQIGYWAAFFNGGPAVTLGIVRGMVQEYAGPFLPWALIAWGLALLWLLARALGRDFAPR